MANKKIGKHIINSETTLYNGYVGNVKFTGNYFIGKAFFILKKIVLEII